VDLQRNISFDPMTVSKTFTLPSCCLSMMPSMQYYGSLVGQAYKTVAASCSAKFAKKVLNLVHLSDVPTLIEEYAATVA